MTTVRRLVVRKLEPVIIDPRRHDAVLFGLDTVVTAERSVFDSSVTLLRQLQEIGVGTAAFSADTFSADKCQDVLTAADIVMLYPLTSMRRFGSRDISRYPFIQAYLRRIGDRPAYQRAIAKAEPGLVPMLG